MMLANLLREICTLTGMTTGQVKLPGVLLLVLVVMVLFFVWLDEGGNDL